MKISINKIIQQKVLKGERVFLPKIGIIYRKDNNLFFSEKNNDIYDHSVLSELEKIYNIDNDTAYKRYEYWRRAITVKENSFDIIHIENLIWIIIDDYNDFFFYPDI